MNLRAPWLVAIWPGMASVATSAGTFLREQLGARKLEALPANEYFDIEKVEIKDGVARFPWLPDCSLFGWKNPGAGEDLLVFIGQAQPGQRGFDFCQHLLDVAAKYGVTRVFTFAAMATQIHPSVAPRVFAVANEKRLLHELEALDVTLLKEGQISGLNGVLLAAAAERNLSGICLLGEVPFFAVGVPNPKASHKVLETFAPMAGIELDLAPLAAQAASMQQSLVELLERMNQAVKDVGGEESPERFELPELGGEPEAEGGLSPRDQRRIERLFRQAARDRSKAIELKAELDRLGIFPSYEDRFLDLFKSGG